MYLKVVKQEVSTDNVASFLVQDNKADFVKGCLCEQTSGKRKELLFCHTWQKRQYEQNFSLQDATPS